MNETNEKTNEKIKEELSKKDKVFAFENIIKQVSKELTNPSKALFNFFIGLIFSYLVFIIIGSVAYSFVVCDVNGEKYGMNDGINAYNILIDEINMKNKMSFEKKSEKSIEVDNINDIDFNSISKKLNENKVIIKCDYEFNSIDQLYENFFPILKQKLMLKRFGEE